LYPALFRQEIFCTIYQSICGGRPADLNFELKSYFLDALVNLLTGVRRTALNHVPEYYTFGSGFTSNKKLDLDRHSSTADHC
jgi:hypothetical protein